MAVITPVPANVQKISGVTAQGISGAAILAGDFLYKKASDGKLYPADNNVSAAEAVVIGCAEADTPGADQPISYALPGAVMDLGALLVVAVTYFLSSTAGRMGLDADVLGGSIQWVTIMGVAKTTAQLIFQPIPSTVQKV